MTKTLTAAAVLSIARSQIGYTENPPGSNKTKYGQAFGWNGVSWCGVFVWWCFLQGGIDLREQGVPGRDAASTNDFDIRLKQAGWQRVSAEDGQPGDVVFYDFGVTAAGDPADDDDHVGFLLRQTAGAYIDAIEGNTSSGPGGSQSNGGGVFQRTRSYSLIRHIYRPPWAALILQEDDMQWDEEHPMSAADARDLGGKSKQGQQRAVGAFIRYPPGVERLRREQTAHFAALTGAISALASKGGLTAAEIEQAAQAGATAALAELGHDLIDDDTPAT